MPNEHANGRCLTTAHMQTCRRYCCSLADAAYSDKHAQRVLDVSLERLQPLCGQSAVHHPVVRAQGDPHHECRSNDAVVGDDRLLVRAADRQDARLHGVLMSVRARRNKSLQVSMCIRKHSWADNRGKMMQEACPAQLDVLVCAVRTCGGLMMAQKCSTPYMPRLLIVNVPPVNSSGFSLLSFACILQ